MKVPEELSFGRFFYFKTLFYSLTNFDGIYIIETIGL